MLESRWMSQAQIILSNPILLAGEKQKKEYRKRLQELVELCHSKDAEIRRWEASVWQIYEAALSGEGDYRGSREDKMRRAYLSSFLLLDIFFLTGCKTNFFQNIRRTRSFKQLRGKSSAEQKKVLDAVCDRFLSSSKRKKRYAKNWKFGKPLETCIDIVKKDIDFQKRTPVRVLITGLMSAGKSTFINALLGRNVMPAQNLACTSKIHALVGKPCDDGFVYEDDAELVLDAGKKELFQDNPQNESDSIAIGIAFHGGLAGCRVVIYDSPGVNSSMNEEHRDVADHFLQSGEADVILYLMNFTQLMTEDDDAHARFVFHALQDKKILFIVNKVDELKEEESLDAAMADVKRYLEEIGFSHPRICPISAAAAFLEKRVTSGANMNPMQQMQYGIYRQKFAATSLSEYYKTHFPEEFGSGKEPQGEGLLRDSGIAYVEQLMRRMAK